MRTPLSHKKVSALKALANSLDHTPIYVMSGSSFVTAKNGEWILTSKVAEAKKFSKCDSAYLLKDITFPDLSIKTL